MKNRIFVITWLAIALATIAGTLTVRAQAAADFNVTTPDGNYWYIFNEDPTQNPIITLERGRTYTFNINTDFIHPFQILPEDGVQNNNINSGVITWQVPNDAQDDAFFYQCSFHGFGNTFHFVDATLPPVPIQLLSISISTNLVLLSTGANETNLFPEYSTNLASTNWYALTVSTNRSFGSTNETICGRPPGTNVFVRIRAVSK